jgi:hypothetical protein
MKRVLPLALLLVVVAACGSKDTTPRATGIPSTTTTASTLPPVTFEQQPETKVLADCTSFGIRPEQIVAFCADAGVILDDLVWPTWTADRATGSGTVHAKLCDPDCAAGGTYDGPVDVTLAKPVDGTFGELTIDWRGADPFQHPTDSYDIATTPIG